MPSQSRFWVDPLTQSIRDRRLRVYSSREYEVAVQKTLYLVCSARLQRDDTDTGVHKCRIPG
jgi:hypothetical protein